MPTPTYDLIEEKVLGSAQASVTFSSIPGTYKDLVLEMIVRGANASADIDVYCRYNGITTSTYSNTLVVGNGSSASSSRQSSLTYTWIGSVPAANAASGTFGTIFHNLMSYANTNVNKTELTRSNDAGNVVRGIVNLWQGTAAVTQIEVYPNVGNWASGCTFRLWGIVG